MIDRYAVMGCPITHSKSPEIHMLFASQTDQALTYEAIHVAPGCFEKAIGEFRRTSGLGLNITLPYKEEAWVLAEDLTERARIARAVNTFVLGEHRVLGDNTDGIGLVRDLTKRCQVDLDGARILLLGAGGAARGVIGPLISAGAAPLVVANRTLPKAQKLADEFLGCLTAVPLCSIPTDREFSIIINSTSVAVNGEKLNLPASLLGPDTICYDMMYGLQPTEFLQWGEALGGKTFDGLGMLVEQAAESFFLWRKVRPDTSSVLSTIRAKIER